jgi:type I restriction enzyme M protein
VLFIDAINEVTRQNAQSFLSPAHQNRIVSAYRAFESEAGFATVVDANQIIERDTNLSIPLHVRSVSPSSGQVGSTLTGGWDALELHGPAFWKQMNDLTDLLQDVLAESDRG